MKKIVGYKKIDDQNFEPIYQDMIAPLTSYEISKNGSYWPSINNKESPPKTNNMNMSNVASHLNLSTPEGMLFNAAMAKLTTECHPNEEYGKVFMECYELAVRINDGKDLVPIMPEPEERRSFEKALSTLINQYSIENQNDTPDFLLAKFLLDCLNNYSATVKARDIWFGVDMWTKDKRIKEVKNGIQDLGSSI